MTTILPAAQTPIAASRPDTTQPLQNPKSEIRNTAAVAAFFTVLTVVMTWPWAIHITEAINPFGDVVLQLAVLRWNTHALITNPTGLFEAPFFYPYAHSIAFSEHDIGQTLTAFPFLLATGNPALAYNLNVLLSFVLTGLFTYLLVRDLTGSRPAAIFAGVAYAFGPFRFMQMGHLHMLATQWFPFVLWTLVRMRNAEPEMRSTPDSSTDTPETIRNPQSAIRNGWPVLFALGLLAMGLSSVYYTLYLAVVLLLYALWSVAVALLTRLRTRPIDHPSKIQNPKSKISLFRIGWPLLPVALILIPVFLPYLQTSADLGLSRTTYELENWSAHWSYFGKVLGSNWLYANVLAPQMTGVLGERQLFFGIVPSILALIGIVWGRGRHRTFFILLGVFSLLMMFGLSARIPGTQLEVPLPYAFFYDWLPGFKALRVPVRFAALLDFSICVLAAYGLVAILRLVPTMRPLRLRSATRNPQSAIAAIAIVLVLIEFANPLDVSNRRDITAQINTTEPYGWLSRPENAGPIIELPMNPDQGDVQYMLYATRHFQPIANGWSGFVPPGTVHLSQAMAAFPDPATISLLRGLEIRHVVVHLWQFSADAQVDLKRRLDSTPELKQVDQAGDNYVYELTPDPWLRDLARQAGPDKYIWVGEPRHDAMPALEVLAYALTRLGVPRDHIAGNISLGYKPLGPLPFGRFPDYALVPNDPGLSNEQLLPVGLAMTRELQSNAAVRVLSESTAASRQSYDLTAANAPSTNLDSLVLTAVDGIIRFGAESSGAPSGGRQPQSAHRTLSGYLLSFGPSRLDVLWQHASGTGRTTWIVPPGVSYLPLGTVDDGDRVTIKRSAGALNTTALHLLRVNAGPTSDNTGTVPLVSIPNVLPIEVTPSKPANSPTLDARMRVIAPPGKGDYTATIDVYVDPWGTHPEGHFGSWSVVLPGDGASHDYTFHLDPLPKTVTTERDGAPLETFPWIGPPIQGDFRANLVITNQDGMQANIPLYTFTLNEDRLTTYHLNPQSLSITPVR